MKDRGATAIVWFRRDLRLDDHPALAVACREYERVVPAFVIDDALLNGRYASAPRARFMAGCLRALDRDLRSLGSRLVVRRGPPDSTLTELARESGAVAVLWTSDISPYARARDRRVGEALRACGVRARPHGGNYVVDVSKLTTRAGTPYRVFSPFFRAWSQAPRRLPEPTPQRIPPLPPGVSSPAWRLDPGADQVPDPVCEPGERAAQQAAEAFLGGQIDRYADRQDGMARNGTSRLSPYLRWGCLSPGRLHARALAAGASAWVRQLCWRDFYAHVLLHNPANLDRELQERRRDLAWDADPILLAAWQSGMTGYPAVDAGMRELTRTGWMHNRARLIVGSFLTKDLHLDWREGERWFARWLLDGEPAQNNGNWQWIASVGTDPAPAFRRIYNPTSQGRRFDPSGAYVREFVPELAQVPDAKLFEPWTMSAAEQRAAGCLIGRDYPAPVVDHRREREGALERYRS